METATFDVATSATRLKKAIDEGRIADSELADVVLERINRVKGVKAPVKVGDAPCSPADVKASHSWVHRWGWPF